jgi:hypothetical protein
MTLRRYPSTATAQLHTLAAGRGHAWTLIAPCAIIDTTNMLMSGSDSQHPGINWLGGAHSQVLKSQD